MTSGESTAAPPEERFGGVDPHHGMKLVSYQAPGLENTASSQLLPHAANDVSGAGAPSV